MIKMIFPVQNFIIFYNSVDACAIMNFIDTAKIMDDFAKIKQDGNSYINIF